MSDLVECPYCRGKGEQRATTTYKPGLAHLPNASRRERCGACAGRGQCRRPVLGSGTDMARHYPMLADIDPDVLVGFCERIDNLDRPGRTLLEARGVIARLTREVVDLRAELDAIYKESA